MVFQKPFQVDPSVEVRDTPDNYRKYASGKDLPGTLKVWCVQNVVKKDKFREGVVISPNGVNKNPNAEILAPGLNTSKEYGAVGVGRYGHFLFWGYSASPSQMTDAGKKFFLNSICYIYKTNQK